MKFSTHLAEFDILSFFPTFFVIVLMVTLPDWETREIKLTLVFSDGRRRPVGAVRDEP